MNIDTVQIVFRTVATTYGTGPFHPAIRTDNDIRYWHTVTFDNEVEAYNYAIAILKDVQDVTTLWTKNWNVVKA